MAQQVINFQKAAPKRSVYTVLVGHQTLHIIHPELFAPKALVKIDGKRVQATTGFDKMYDIQEWDRNDKTVHVWTSKNSYYSELDAQQRTMINSIKAFMNTAEWRTLAVFHDTECRQNKQYSYGNHLHMVVETEVKQLSRQGKYRRMQTDMNKMGGICTLREIKTDPRSFIKYLAEDEEKQFLGANSDSLREQWAQAEGYAYDDHWELGEDEVEEGETLKRKPQFITKVAEAKEPTVDEPAMQVPSHLHKAKAADNVDFVIKVLKEHKECTTIHQLATKVGLMSETGRAICHIALSSNGQKTFQLALNKLQETQQNKSLEQLVKELPDEIPQYMSVRKSQCIFNTWCKEQNISPRKYAMTVQMLLGGKTYKRIGLYLQGAPSSGKTALTNNIWNCLGGEVGRITKETFCFQDCAGKRLIIGEEVAITESNVDRYKDLLSGSTMKCEIKNKGPEDCTPKVVMINSNIKYTQNIGRASSDAIKVRLYTFENLRRVGILAQVTDHFHPRLFYQNVIPLSQEEVLNITQNTGDWTDEPIGYGQQYTGSWEEIMQDPDDTIPSSQGFFTRQEDDREPRTSTPTRDDSQEIETVIISSGEATADAEVKWIEETKDTPDKKRNFLYHLAILERTHMEPVKKADITAKILQTLEEPDNSIEEFSINPYAETEEEMHAIIDSEDKWKEEWNTQPEVLVESSNKPSTSNGQPPLKKKKPEPVSRLINSLHFATFEKHGEQAKDKAIEYMYKQCNNFYSREDDKRKSWNYKLKFGDYQPNYTNNYINNEEWWPEDRSWTEDRTFMEGYTEPEYYENSDFINEYTYVQLKEKPDQQSHTRINIDKVYIHERPVHHITIWGVTEDKTRQEADTVPLQPSTYDTKQQAVNKIFQFVRLFRTNRKHPKTRRSQHTQEDHNTIWFWLNQTVGPCDRLDVIRRRYLQQDQTNMHVIISE